MSLKTVQCGMCGNMAEADEFDFVRRLCIDCGYDVAAELADMETDHYKMIDDMMGAGA